MNRTWNSRRWRVITAYLSATSSRSTPAPCWKGLLLRNTARTTILFLHLLAGQSGFCYHVTSAVGPVDFRVDFMCHLRPEIRASMESTKSGQSCLAPNARLNDVEHRQVGIQSKLVLGERYLHL